MLKELIVSTALAVAQPTVTDGDAMRDQHPHVKRK
jgi:hypothetical protein